MPRIRIGNGVVVECPCSKKSEYHKFVARAAEEITGRIRPTEEDRKRKTLALEAILSVIEAKKHPTERIVWLRPLDDWKIDCVYLEGRVKANELGITKNCRGYTLDIQYKNRDFGT